MNIFFIGNDEQEFTLPLFEDEDKYSVVETKNSRKVLCGQPDSTCFMGNGEISFTFPCNADFMW